LVQDSLYGRHDRDNPSSITTSLPKLEFNHPVIHCPGFLSALIVRRRLLLFDLANDATQLVLKQAAFSTESGRD
jgi:hypothetical protein